MVNLCKDINFNNFEIVGIKVYYSNDQFVTYPIVMNINWVGAPYDL